MKRTLSLCLVVVMLLGMVAMTASATEAVAIDTYNLSLGDDITINFNVTGLTPGQDYDVTIATDASETTYALTITGDEAGKAVVSFDQLNPSMLATKVTVSIDGTEASLTKSVLDYCEWALGEMNNANELFALVVDLMNYGAAAQAYLNEDATANASLTDLQKMFATAAPAVDAEYLYPETLDGAAIEWIGAAPLLGESVAYRYKFTVAEEYVASLAETEFVITVGTNDYIVSGADAEDAGDYWFIVFADLNPAQLMEDATIVAKNADNAVSGAWTFSAERYAAWALTQNNDKLTNLVNSILSYAAAADAYTDDVANTNTIKVTEVTTVQAADKFDLYRKVMNLATIANYTMCVAKTGQQAGAAYEAVGLDITSADLYGGTEWVTFGNIGAALFDNSPVNAGKNKDGTWKYPPATKFNTPSDEKYIANYCNMLVDKTWDGACVNIEGSEDYEFATYADDLQIGDILVFKGNAEDTTDSTTYGANFYLTLLYQGNGKFIGGLSATSKSARWVELTADEVDAICNNSGSNQAKFYAYSDEAGKNRYTFTASTTPYAIFVLRPYQQLTKTN